MKCFVFLLLLHGVLGHYRFGESYLENSLLCKPWVCITSHLNLPSEPSPSSYAVALKPLLPQTWNTALDTVVALCSAVDRPRQYTDTCPGQEMLHCIVDNLIEQCPESNLRKEDACAPVSSLAGFKYMFSQSRYENLEKYLPTERRPVWFLRNYFSTKCCDLPQIFNDSVLQSCGFDSMMHYYGHLPRPKFNFFPVIVNLQPDTMPMTTSAPAPETVKVVELSDVDLQPMTTPAPSAETVKVVDVAEVDDLMSCCDLSEFIPPQSRMECNFATEWDSEKRLSVLDREPNSGAFVTTTTTTTPPPPKKHHDVKVVPLNCQSEICVFSQMNVTSSDGKVNVEAFSKLLDLWTQKHPEWSSAKARAITGCLRKPMFWKHDCELNVFLECVFDVLSENCPSNKKTAKDPCKHLHEMKNDTICRINASKYKLKNRRLFCDFPPLVDHRALAKCNVSSIYRIESIPDITYRKPSIRVWKPTCKETPKSSLCLMSKMGVLNKYNFMDYFRMKDRIRKFTNNEDWAALSEVYISSFNSMPLYRDHCGSHRKFLNVIDSMIMTCPVTKRQNTPKCNRMFDEMAKNFTVFDSPKTKVDQIYKQMYSKNHVTVTEKTDQKTDSNSKKNPILDYGIFGMKVPPVKIIPITPQIMKKENRKPLIVLPVYSHTTVPTLTTPHTPEVTTPSTPEYITQSPLNQPNSDYLYSPNTQFIPTPYQHIPSLSGILDRYRFPREFPSVDSYSGPFPIPNSSPYYGPFDKDSLWRSGVKFERLFTNGHSGNDLGIDIAKPE